MIRENVTKLSLCDSTVRYAALSTRLVGRPCDVELLRRLSTVLKLYVIAILTR